MIRYSDLVEKKYKIAVIGMGYVGMPMAIELAKQYDVIGFDINKEKIDNYKSGEDPTQEVGRKVLSESTINFSSDERDLDSAKMFIVAVPTPINQDKTPDLYPVISASELVGRHLSKDSIVVYESTVYPGVTEDECAPILEKISGMNLGADFKIGYSPERINPGDKVHTFKNIKKIVSGMDRETLEFIAQVYESVIDAGVYRASSIKVAEAAKVAENSQRDINIAFMNELAIVFDKMGIDSNEVVDAMNTKWNALGFRPGLVGGHCIGVDPYYFIYEAEKLGYHSQIILAGRQINDSMSEFIGQSIIKNLIKADKVVRKAKVVILGITFKENCPDIRNSKVFEIIDFLEEYGIEPIICDPWVNREELMNQSALELTDIQSITDADAVVFAVAHNEYREHAKEICKQLFSDKAEETNVVVDVKGIVPRDSYNIKDIYWRL